ncbi:hypothetical protein OSH08_05505 [Kaistia geumhonensis]|uniref:Uncharacterized protein n=1 Tax=Kaistia geumhonensis TaxID=410839 RepID=A0ABU0M5Y3_9HYPH|nr:hypothetical protein [Kaistia geumhonensis]MCX5478449.1 hypothetical protein [Kaistia geumhonensis]MDQ0516333.1 hypothetical protein [Kaistia geumhonensis]
MGFTPRDVDDMSFWEFAACVDGFNTANGAEPDVEPPTAEEYHDMVRRLG